MLLQSREFERAAISLQRLLATDPGDRPAREMLAFALESMGKIREERRVRAALAADFPDEPAIQAGYGRVLERSGDAAGALRAYRRARELEPAAAASELDAAIERTRERSSVEVAAPTAFLTDPGGSVARIQAGTAIPIGPATHLAVLGTSYSARSGANRFGTQASALALTLARVGPGVSWSAGPRWHLFSPPGMARHDLGTGAGVTARAALGASFEAAGAAELDAPWDDAAIAVLRGGRSTAVEGHVYSHAMSRRLLLQAGARVRRLSIVTEPMDAMGRATARQSLWLAGADVVLWNRGAALPGEVLDESLVAPTSIAPGATLAYRHYDVTSRPTPEFGSTIGLAPRGIVDEASIATTLAASRQRLGIHVQAGLAHDSARDARMWRGGAGLFWTPTPGSRVTLGYEQADETVTGLEGRRQSGWFSVHVHL